MTDAELRREMASVVREMLGDGYVDSYYLDLASPFVQVAKAYAAEVDVTVRVHELDSRS